MKESLSPHLSRDRVCTKLLNPRNNAPKNRKHTVNHFLGYTKCKKRDAKYVRDTSCCAKLFMPSEMSSQTPDKSSKKEKKNHLYKPKLKQN